jgi:hypothetical protein
METHCRRISPKSHKPTKNPYKMKKALSVFILTMVCALCNPNTTYAAQTFKIGQKTFLLDGKPFVVKAA